MSVAILALLDCLDKTILLQTACHIAYVTCFLASFEAHAPNIAYARQRLLRCMLVLPGRIEVLRVEICIRMQAQGLSSFLLPMLEYAPDKRATAAEMLRHPWLQGCLPKIAALDLNRDVATDRQHRRKSSHSRSASAHAAKRSR